MLIIDALSALIATFIVNVLARTRRCLLSIPTCTLERAASRTAVNRADRASPDLNRTLSIASNGLLTTVADVDRGFALKQAIGDPEKASMTMTQRIVAETQEWMIDPIS